MLCSIKVTVNKDHEAHVKLGKVHIAKVLVMKHDLIAIRDGRIVGDSSQKEIVHDDVYAPA